MHKIVKDSFDEEALISQRVIEEQYHHLFEVQQQQLKMLEDLQTQLKKLKPE